MSRLFTINKKLNLIDMKKLCRNARHQQNLQQGKVYNVDYTHKCKCGTVVYGLKEIKEFDTGKDPNLGTMCSCNTRINHFYPLYNSNRFEDMSELTVENFLKEERTKVNKLIIHGVGVCS